MKYPPIAPCKLKSYTDAFYEMDEEWYQCGKKIYELQPGSSERMYCAAVQRCVWLDIAERFREQYQSAVMNCCSVGQMYIMATTNAEEWRIWGMIS